MITALSCSKSEPQYEYADGNGNRYVLSRSSMHYYPVNPKESSTGTYSGGEPKSVALTPKQYRQLQELIEKAIQNSTIHLPARTKMSGLITAYTDGNKKQYIIDATRAETKAIEDLLRGYLNHDWITRSGSL